MAVVQLSLSACSGKATGMPDGDDGPAAEQSPTNESPAGNVLKGDCGKPGDLVPDDAYSLEMVTTRLVGRWVNCSGLLFGQQHDGLELAAAGTWFLLKLDANGELQPVGGFDGGGSWSLSDTSEINGPGPFGYQLNIDSSIGGVGAFSLFQDNPSALRLSTMSGPVDYVPEMAE